MTWARLDDGFGEHPKVVGLSDAAYRLHVNAICYSARNLTDGVVPVGALRSLGKTGKSVTELTTCGLWEPGDGGYLIHDYLDYNPSREQVERERKVVSEARSAAGRKGAQVRWQTDSNGDGKTMTNGMANAWQTHGPVPDPVPLPLTPTEETIVSSSGVGTAHAPKPPRRTKAGIEVMTDSQFSELAERYGQEYVLGKLEYGRNRQDWETKHKSEYATIKRWCEQDVKDFTGEQQPFTDTTEGRRKKFLGGSLGRFIKTGDEVAG